MEVSTGFSPLIILLGEIFASLCVVTVKYSFAVSSVITIESGFAKINDKIEYSVINER